MPHTEKAWRRRRAPNVERPDEGSAQPSGCTPGRRRSILGFTIGASASAVSTAHANAGSLHMLAFTVNHGLIAAGVTAAIGSASFAGFMLTRNNSHPLFGGIEHLMIFAQPIGGAESHRRLIESNSHWSFDYNATGSIDRTEPRRAGIDGAPPRDGDKAESPRTPIKEYVLRFARRGAVVVQGPKGNFAAAPGVMLPGAGRILSIQNRNGRWVVQTENGIIGESEF